MLTDHQTEVRTHKNKHRAEKFENLIGVFMVIAIAILAIGLIYGIVSTGGSSTPSYLR